MNSEKNAPRFLGAAFLVVVVTSALGGALNGAAVGSGSMSEILGHISSHTALMRAGIIAELATCLGIIALAALLYAVLKGQNRILALVALLWWTAEALLLAVAQFGSFALIPLSLKFSGSGGGDASPLLPLAGFLYYGLAKQGYTLLMFFYCAGGILWYFLLYKSRLIPRAISLFGLAAVCVGLAGILFACFGYSVPMYVYLPILPFELTVGAWLMIKGIKE